MNSFFLTDNQKSFDLCNKLLSFPCISKSNIKKVLHNRIIATNYVIDRFINYPEDIVKSIKPSGNNLVTFSITSCKRFDLFEKTMNSFLNCCSDLDKIDKWICVDDNSSKEERQKMVTKYPFFEYIMKGPAEKGHVRSMNIIREKVDSPYLFHMEDDWQFYEKRNYITECLEILGQDIRIGQCLINKNYGEVPEDMRIIGGVSNTTETGLRYFTHEFVNNSYPKKKWMDNNNLKSDKVVNCTYWPHFSFRPSLIRKKVFNEIGEFKKCSHFEMEYASRYVCLGYKSAFLETIYSRHIGRLTKDRNNTTKKNAYSLNGVEQFNKVEDIKMKTFVINLENRTDRLDKFTKEATNAGFKDYDIFKAVNGNKLKPNCQLDRIFEGNDYNMRTGIVGCALSHIQLCIDLLNSDNDLFVILEDDIELCNNFSKKLNMIINGIKNINWDIIYLGHHLRNEDKGAFEDKIPKLEKWSKFVSFQKSLGGTGGYIISKKGAKGLLEYINSTGMTNGIDTVQQKLADDLNIYYCYPHIIKAECVRGEKYVDSDIQYNYTSLTRNIVDCLLDEKNHYRELHKITNIKKFKNEFTDTNYYFLGEKNEINSLVNFCKESNLKYYIVYSKIVVINNSGKERMYVERLKVDGKFDIRDSLKYLDK
jgi:GR25 family glycosyltransferase involved in LPS biosynthesis